MFYILAKTINVQDELERLSHEKKQCLVRAKRLSNEHDKSWKEEIIILAQIIEREYVLLEQHWLINTISEDIANLYREQDIPIWDHIERYLPEKC